MISVLYVDDEQDLLEVARLFLEESGDLHVSTFTSAQGALGSQEIASCDAIISDYQMPGMDGIVFLKEIRQKFGDIPFILFTGRGREEVVIQAINNGADFYLQKGGDPEAQFAELAHKIRQAVKRKQAERSLQESEKRLSDIINFLPDATFAIDRSGHVIAWNRAIEEMTGVAAADMLGKGGYEYAVPFYGIRRPILIDLIFEPDNVIRERYAHIIHEKDILIADTTLPRPKGKEVTLLGKASPLYNREGEIIGAIESIRDITDLKRAERDLQRSEEWFRNIIQNSSDMIRIIGKDGLISYSSPSTKRILGYDRSTLIGKDPFEFIHPDDRKHARLAFDEVVKNTNPHSPTEYRLRHADGHYVDVEAVANNLIDVQDINGVVVTVRPITERKRVEAALRESQKQLALALEVSDAGVWQWNITTNEVFFDEQFHTMLGYAPGELPRTLQEWLSYHHPDDMEIWRPKAEAYLRGESTRFESEHRIRTRSGDWAWVLSRGRHIQADEPGSPRWFSGIAMNVTGRKLAEDAIREREAKYRELADLLPQIVFEIDTEFRITYANKHLLSMLGLTSEDLARGVSGLSVINSSEHAQIREVIRKQLKGEPYEPREYTFIRKDGSTFPAVVYSTPIYRNSALAGFRGVIVDISSRKKMELALLQKNEELNAAFEQISAAQEELRQNYDELRRSEQVLRDSEEKFRTLVEHSLDGIIITDFSGTILFANRSASRIVGIERHETNHGVISVLDFVAPEYHEDMLRNLREISEGSDSPLLHYKLVTSTPRDIWVECIGKKITYGEKDAILVSLRDVTGRRTADEELIKSERKFVTVFQNNPIPLVLASAQDGSFIEVNEAFLDNTGFTRGEVIGRTVESLGIFPDSEESAQLRSALQSKQYVKGMVIHCRRKNGEIRVCRFSSNIVMMEKRPLILSTIEDITEQKTAENLLQESQRTLSTLMGNLPGMAYRCRNDVHWTMEFVSEGCEELTGYKTSDLIGNKRIAFADLIHPDDRQQVSQKIQSALENDQKFQIMYRIRTKSGDEKWVWEQGLGIPTPSGDTSAIEGFISDITERRMAEAALRESEDKFRRISENAPDMVYHMSIPEGRYEYVSPVSVALTGYTPEEFYSDPQLIKRLIHPDWRRYLEEQQGALLKGNIPPTYEFQIIDRAGKVHWINQRNMLVKDDQGQPVAIEGIVTDITKQKETERELKRSELRFLAVSENAGSWIWEVDEEGIYRYSSPAVMRILGYRPDEIVGRMHFYDMFDSSVQEALKSTALGAFKSQEPFRDFINLNRHRNGTQVILNTSATPVFDETGKFSGYCGVDVDITEQTATQNALQAIVKSIVGTTGLPSLRQITENISSWLGADCVMIGEIQEDGQTVKVLSMLLDGKEVSDFYYTLKGTPCENAAEKGFCLYQDEVRKIFPGCRDLDELNIRGYVGTPLRNSNGQVFGILCALSRAPLKSTPSLQEIMDIIAVKAAAEIEGMQMNRALRESEQKFRSLVEYSLEGILILDFQGTVLFANNSIARMLDLEDSAGLRGRNVMEFVAPESMNDALKDFGEVARGHDAYLAQYKVITAKGNEIFVESIGKVISYEGKNADLVSVHDITERKKAEDALSRSQHLLAEAMDLAHLVNWEYDVSSGMFTFDDRFYALYGTTAEREGGNLMSAETYAREFVHPDDGHLVQEEVLRDMATTDPHYTALIEHRIIRRDGEIRTIAVRIGITKDSEGRTIKTHGANQDITDIRKAEAALLESEEKYRSLVETTPGMIWEIDTQGIFRYISPMVRTIMGFEPDELVGKPITELIVEPGRSLVLQRLAGHITSDGAIPPLEVPARNRDGREMTIEIRPSRITRADGKLVGLRGVAYDVTERRKAEEALTRANRQLNLLGSITRHDLLNKITIILGNLKIAERMVTDPAILEHLGKIRSATDAIKSQIEFTRIYQKIGTHEPQWIDLDTVMPTTSLPPSITLHTDVSGVSVLADPMLERVFFNLLDNSIRHGKGVAEITVSTRFFGDNLVVVWEDDGIGIPADDKSLIFEREFGSNTGLGLFLAREILSLTGITILENGEPGGGARFEITIPKGAYRNSDSGRIQ